MTPEEKNALLQFMGMTYGHSHKLDTHIVGNSQFVKPISTTVKQVFEQVLKSDTNNNPSFNHTPVSTPELENTYTETVPVTIPEKNVESTFVVEKTDPVVYNDSAEQLKVIAQQLTRIGDILETVINKNNVRPKKKAKVNVKE